MHCVWLVSSAAMEGLAVKMSGTAMRVCISMFPACLWVDQPNYGSTWPWGRTWWTWAREVVGSKKECLDFDKILPIFTICLRPHECQRPQARRAKRNAPKASTNKSREVGCPAGFKQCWCHQFKIGCGHVRLLARCQMHVTKERTLRGGNMINLHAIFTAHKHGLHVGAWQ